VHVMKHHGIGQRSGQSEWCYSSACACAALSPKSICGRAQGAAQPCMPHGSDRHASRENPHQASTTGSQAVQGSLAQRACDVAVRAAGKAGVALSTLGPGATNFTTSAAYAQLGGFPMLLITGSHLRCRPSGPSPAIKLSQRPRWKLTVSQRPGCK